MKELLENWQLLMEEEGKKDACYHKVKSRYKKWPSAYASGALVKCRKVGAANWGESDKKNEEMELEEEWSESEREKRRSKCDNPKGFTMKQFCKNQRTRSGEGEKKNEAKKAGTESSKESNLGDWFKRKGESGSKGGWVDCNTCRKDKKTGRTKCKACGRSKGEKRAKYPACRPTPGACKERGRGKSWGKTSAKKEGLEMNNDLRQIVKEELQKALFKPGLLHHVENKIPVSENIYRPGSPCFFNVIRQARAHYKSGLYEALNDEERDLLENSNLGEWAVVEGKRVPLDFPMYISEALTKTEIDFDEWFSIVQHNLREDGFDPKREEKGAHQSYLSGYTPDEYEEEWLASKGLLEAKKKKDPPLNKPMRNSGSGKKYKVYVRDPSTGNVKTVTYGDAKGGLKGGWNSAEARKSFAARHDCENKKDKTKAGYWACRAHKDFGPGVGRFW